jgi:hypothetical protein
MTYFVNPSERRKIPPMITDSNQVRLAKMAGRRVQEGVHVKGDCEYHLQTWSGKLILAVMITEENKQKRQTHC